MVIYGSFSGPYDMRKYISSCVFTGPTIRTSYSFFVLFFFKSGVYSCLLAVLILVSQVICPSLRLSSPRPQSTSTAPNSQQQEFDNKQQQHPPANSSTPNRPESISHLETVSPTRLHRVLRSRVNDYGNNWSQTDRLYSLWYN